MTDDRDWIDKINYACGKAGRGSVGWNFRFIDTLRRTGLTLRPATPEETLCRPEDSIDAPYPHPGDPYFRWPIPSLIVEEDRDE